MEKGLDMDLLSASAFVMVVSENFSQYPIETQRNLLEGIFQLADECKEELSQLPETATTVHLGATLTLLKSLISDALKAGDLREGFRQAAQCFWPIGAPNFEGCKSAKPNAFSWPPGAWMVR